MVIFFPFLFYAHPTIMGKANERFRGLNNINIQLKSLVFAASALQA
jgi:hypothetical protein